MRWRVEPDRLPQARRRHADASVNGDLKGSERVLLLGLELMQPLVRVQGAAERHRELVAIGLPAFGGQ